jgi:hypothetical protein
MSAPPRTIFTLRLVGTPGQAGIHSLRALLKRLLRQHNFVCIDARESSRSDNQLTNPDRGQR